MLFDSHIHVGQFYNLYFSPLLISNLMKQVHADHYAVSSTTMCEENYPKVIEEIQSLVDLDGKKVFPVMWITPEGLKGNIAWFLESNIAWKSLKVHPELHPHDWQPDGGQFTEVVDIARELRLPILIHTGEKDCCQCGKYASLIAHNKDVNFILAHGRPFYQLLPIIRKYANAYTDSAFMPVSDMALIIKAGLSHKLLWGTDMCIPKYFYPQKDMVEYYLYKIATFRQVCTQEQFDAVTYSNALNLLYTEK